MGGGARAGQLQAAYCSVDSTLEPIHCAPKTVSVYPGRRFTVPQYRDTVNHFFYHFHLKRVQTGKVTLPQFNTQYPFLYVQQKAIIPLQ